MRIIKTILIFSLTIFAAQAVADPLLLSDAEMQKLKNYFPAQDGSPHFLWNGDPIGLQLPVGKERRVVFPSHVTVDIKGQLTTDQLKIINNDKSVYLTAMKPFSSTRIYVTLQDSNEVVLIDLSTDEKASTEVTYIDVKQNNNAATSNTAGTVSSSIVDNNSSLSAAATTNVSSDSTTGEDYVSLIRYAWQQLYTPERLLENTQTLPRSAMHTESLISTLVYGDKVIAHPEIAWVSNNTYVTAVELRNKYAHKTTINLAHDICGNWQAATLYPSATLEPLGNKQGDSATLILVSKKPFGDSMGVCNGHA